MPWLRVETGAEEIDDSEVPKLHETSSQPGLLDLGNVLFPDGADYLVDIIKQYQQYQRLLA